MQQKSAPAAPHHLSQEEQEKCREAFFRFDKDRNGTIDVSER
jgi:Ca2+-binding EF-hand superfamily protein